MAEGTIGFTTLEVIPTMRGTTADLHNQFEGPIRDVGERLGREMAEAMARGIRQGSSDVQRATQQAAQGNQNAASSANQLADANRNAAQSQTQVADSSNAAAAASDNNAKKSLLSKDNMLMLGAAAATAAAGIGAALISIAGTFDDVEDTIRAGTGATGDMLDGLVASAKNVGTTVPAEFDAIAPVITDLNKRLGLTGPTLETLASQLLTVSNITGEDLNVESLSAGFSAFGVTGDETTAVMDRLFQISQKTGVGMQTLSDAALKGAPQLKQFGFSMDESAALVGLLDKAGVDAEKTVAGMGKAMIKFAQDGKDPQVALFENARAIEDFIKKGDEVAALDLASELFGTKGAGQFVEAVKTGAFAIDDLQSMMGTGGDTILAAGADTADFAEQWLMFKNKVLVELEPIATRVFGAITTFATWINDNAIPIVKDFADWIQRNADTFKEVGIALAPLAAVLGTYVVALGTYKAVTTTISAVTKGWAAAQLFLNTAIRANPVMAIVTAIGALVAGLIYAYRNSETFRNVVQSAWQGIQSAFSAAWGFIQPILQGIASFFTDTVAPAVMSFWHGVIEPALGGIKAAFDLWWAGVQIVFDLYKAAFNIAAEAVMWFWHTIIEPAFAGIKTVFDLWWAGVQIVFDAWKLAFEGIGAVASWLWENAIKPAFEGIGTVISFAWDNVIKPAFDLFKSGVEGLGTAFGTVKETISVIWDGIIGLVAKGVKLIGQIMQKVKIPDWVPGVGGKGLTGLGDELVSWAEAHGAATGLTVRGPGTGTSDDVPMLLSNGEEVIKTKSAEKWRWLLKLINADSPLLKKVFGMAGGGTVTPDETARMGGGTVNASLWAAVKNAVPDAVLNSAKTDHDDDGGFHPQGKAIDINPSNANADYLWGIRDQLGQIITTIPGRLWYNVNGERAEGDKAADIYGWATVRAHDDHIHAMANREISGAPTMDNQTAAAATPQDKIADQIIAEGRRRGMSDKAIKIALATALVESNFQNYANSNVPESLNLPHDAVGSDHDSVGVFQQRESWGTLEQRMDPTQAAGLFYEALNKVEGFETMDPGAAAQAVQRSAFPGRYNERMGEAEQVFNSRQGAAGAGGSSSSATSGEGQKVFVTNWPGGSGAAGGQPGSSPSTGSAPGAFSPGGGTGDTYNQQEAVNTALSNGASNFQKAGQSFIEGQLGATPFGGLINGVRQTVNNWTVVVKDVEEFWQKKSAEDQRRALSPGSRF